ncbi:MAG: 3-hydroxyisobutyrate dehydrogenase [Pseudomonadota bacterium]
MTTIAFIGLGNMGSGMALNQVRAGRTVQAYDLSKAALKAAEAGGCKVAKSAADAVAGADVVITMLPAGQHVMAVYEADVLPHAAPGTLLVDCSTIDVDTARAVAERAAAAGFRAADAPVSGGTAAAEAGTLAFMVGCEASDFDDVDEALGPMSKVVIHAGASGAGQAAKICNNMLLGISMIGTCEAFALAEKLGLGADRFFEIAKQSSGQCWSVTSYCPVKGAGPETPADRNYAPGFATDMMLKDLKLAQSAAASVNAATPMGAQAEALYAMFSGMGRGGKDFSAIIDLLSPGTVKPG